jgi:hypothetical protein
MLQLQLATSLLPATEYVYVGQSSHVDSDVAAVAVLYFPSVHSEHAADPFTSLNVPCQHMIKKNDDKDQEIKQSTFSHTYLITRRAFCSDFSREALIANTAHDG